MTDLTHILRVARAGNPARALQLFGQQDLDAVTFDPEALTLKGRLLKDQAKRASGQARRELFVEASRAYQAAHALDPSSYPLINAASLACFSGDVEQSRTLAAQTLAMVENDPEEGETTYWREATRSEALLLLDRRDEAEESLARAIEELPRAYEDLAATLGQFELILAEKGEEASWLDRYRPPASLHFSGLIGLEENEPGLREAISDTIEAAKPGFAYGALAAGADIIIAELLITAGAELHVHLPNEPEAFREASVAPYGLGWGERFDQLLSRAETVTILEPVPGLTPRPFANAIDLADLSSMGACLRQARVLQSRAEFATVHAKGESLRPSLEICQAAGHSLAAIEARRVGGGPKSGSASPGSPLALKCVIAVPRLAAESQQEAITLGIRPVERGTMTVLLGDVTPCLDLLQKSGPVLCAKGAGLLIGDAQNAGALEERAAQLGAVAETGQCLTDRLSSSVATVVRHSVQPEEIGEIRTLEGPLSLWALPVQPA